MSNKINMTQMIQAISIKSKLITNFKIKHWRRSSRKEGFMRAEHTGTVHALEVLRG